MDVKAGWYADPEDPQAWRWWDGHAWAPRQAESGGVAADQVSGVGRESGEVDSQPSGWQDFERGAGEEDDGPWAARARAEAVAAAGLAEGGAGVGAVLDGAGTGSIHDGDAPDIENWAGQAASTAGVFTGLRKEGAGEVDEEGYPIGKYGPVVVEAAGIPASWGFRLGAGLIDGFILMILMSIVGGVGFLFVGVEAWSKSAGKVCKLVALDNGGVVQQCVSAGSGRTLSTGAGYVAGFLLLTIIAWGVAQSVAAGGRGGVGARLLRMRRVRDDLVTSIGVGRGLLVGFVIAAVFAVPAFAVAQLGGIGLFFLAVPVADWMWPLLNYERQALHDKIAGAFLVDVPRKA